MSTKHKNAAKSAAENSKIFKFMSNSKWSSEKEKISAAEGSSAYHTVVHGQSFLSADCVSSGDLFQKMFPDSIVVKNFSSAQTKTAKIITSKFLKSRNRLLP